MPLPPSGRIIHAKFTLKLMGIGGEWAYAIGSAAFILKIIHGQLDWQLIRREPEIRKWGDYG
jgi:hypothetical protein